MLSLDNFSTILILSAILIMLSIFIRALIEEYLKLKEQGGGRLKKNTKIEIEDNRKELMGKGGSN